MKNYKLYNNNFETDLGVVSLEIESNIKSKCSITQKDSLTTIDTLNHIIEIFEFCDIKEWLNETDNSIEQSKGWLIRITKVSSNLEHIQIRCELIHSVLKADANSGEWLDSVWIENATHFLSIGTEDGEMLRERAKRNDLMPKRFEKELGFPSKPDSFTKYTDGNVAIGSPDSCKCNDCKNFPKNTKKFNLILKMIPFLEIGLNYLMYTMVYLKITICHKI